MGGQEIGGYVSSVVHVEMLESVDMVVHPCAETDMNRSDADSDVLADFVLALIQSDASDEELRKVSVENLEDFLREREFSIARTV